MKSKEPGQKEINPPEGSNYVAVSISYSTIVVSQKKAMQLFDALTHAEVCSDGLYEIERHGHNLNLTSQAVRFESATISPKMYREAKIRLLLGVNSADSEEN